jgi:hypothetical protein
MYLNDHVNTLDMQPDGKYNRRTYRNKPNSAQLQLLEKYALPSHRNLSK